VALLTLQAPQQGGEGLPFWFAFYFSPVVGFWFSFEGAR
jgi:hypothetical protein